MTAGVRIEQDSLGTLAVPRAALWGIHTERAILNFPISGIQFCFSSRPSRLRP